MVTEENVARAVRVFDRVTRMLASVETLADDPSLGKVELLALRYLGTGERPTMSELARAAGVAVSTATKIVDRLVEKELVERTRNGGDRRIVRVALTDRGEKVVAAHAAQMREAVAKMLAALDPVEQDRFIVAWERIADAADAPGNR